MELTAAQKTTLKTFIQANYPTLNDQQITDALNAANNPAFTVWKSQETLDRIWAVFNLEDLAGLTTANTNRLTALAAAAVTVAPSRSDVRAFFDDIYSSAPTTKAALLAFWKRTATVLEKLFATGTGSDAVPATLGTGADGLPVEGDITTQQVIDVLS